MMFRYSIYSIVLTIELFSVLEPLHGGWWVGVRPTVYVEVIADTRVDVMRLVLNQTEPRSRYSVQRTSGFITAFNKSIVEPRITWL